jgi:uncharacterized protein YkwD
MSRPARSARNVLISAVIGLLATAAMLTTAGAQAAASYDTSSYAARLLDLVNIARSQHGLRPLVRAPGTTTVAAAWTQHLADDRALSHNSQLGRQLAAHGSKSWRVYGENVGVGSATDPDGLFKAYWNSPEHRANILNRSYRYVGVAVLLTGSRAWNTFDFVDVYGRAQPTRHVGRRHVQSHVSTTAARPSTGETHRPAARPLVVQVKALHQTSAHRPAAQRPVNAHVFVGVVAGPVHTAASGHGVVGAVQLPEHRTHTVMLAAAVLAVLFAARRWMLAAAVRRTT